MIESILIISVFLNIVLISCIYLSDDCTELKLENQKLQFENQIITREYNKSKSMFNYLRDNDVKVDWEHDGAIIFYMPEEDSLRELFEGWLE